MCANPKSKEKRSIIYRADQDDEARNLRYLFSLLSDRFRDNFYSPEMVSKF